MTIDWHPRGSLQSAQGATLAKDDAGTYAAAQTMNSPHERWQEPSGLPELELSITDSGHRIDYRPLLPGRVSRSHAIHKQFGIRLVPVSGSPDRMVVSRNWFGISAAGGHRIWEDCDEQPPPRQCSRIEPLSRLREEVSVKSVLRGPWECSLFGFSIHGATGTKTVHPPAVARV